MSIAETFLPEFDHEVATTRRVLERVPEDKFDWKPHSKSASMGWLAGHVANIPTWAEITMRSEKFDLDSPEAQQRTPLPASHAELLERFERNIAAARAAIAGADDQAMMQTWSLIAGGRAVLTLPRAAVIRNMVMNHGIHHRAQLCVYLRLNDVPVPAIYGPSADESGR